MNDHDRDNLRFLLTASEESLAEWYKILTPDEMDYALDLVQMAYVELIDQAVDTLTEYSDANIVLQHIRNKL